jgi:hypothetical protein
VVEEPFNEWGEVGKRTKAGLRNMDIWADD